MSILPPYYEHICVDLITDGAVIAYLHKYCFKLADYLRARILYNNNEIEAYRSVRYISSSEAMWHIFGFRTHFRTPSVNYFSYTFLTSNPSCTMKPTT